MREEKIEQMRNAHKVATEFPFEIKELSRGYADRTLRIDLDKNEITILPVTQQMKDLWVGGKGFDLWLMFREITKDTKWDSPENPICFSSGPLGGTTSFPGAGKTLVTAVSPITQSVMDCNVGGFFGPFLKFAGFDALVIIGKAKKETIIYIDAVNKKITIEEAPLESIDSHLLAEELTGMYASDELDKRNIAVVSAGRAAQYSRMGMLNFSFWDWRRNVARLKQAGRGGIGRVFRDKHLKALVIKSRDITPAWRIEENKVAKWVTPKKISIQGKEDIPVLEAIIEKWGNDPEYVVEMMLDIQERFHHISKTAIDLLLEKTGVPQAYLYHMATFYKDFSLEKQKEHKVYRGPACRLEGSASVLDLYNGKGKPDSTSSGVEKAPREIEFFSKQPLIVLRHKGVMDPGNIDQYVTGGGYLSLKKVLEENNPQVVIQEVLASGLRGRGGGGYPTGLKWQAAYEAQKEKNDAYVICNADEGDPAAFTARGIIEADPHSVIEGMLIGAFAVGAREGIIYLNKEYTLAGERLDKAITAAREKGFLGEKILGTDFSFDIEVHRSPGDFICGESTAMITAFSGRTGEPQPKYIHSTESGFRQEPTIASNVETWANIPVIIEKGAGWFASIGGEVQNHGNGSNGTKVFSLSGDVRNRGLVEVPLGTTLKEIVEDLGGGIPGGRKFKAVLIGGPSGGCIPVSLLEMKIDFDTLTGIGAIMGSGSMMVMDDRTCIVDAVYRWVKFLAGESCGKCTPCREGLYALANTLNRICRGEGKEGDLKFMENTANTIKETSLCQLGGTAPNPLLSSLHYFREEYEEHVKNKKCLAGVCKNLKASE